MYQCFPKSLVYFLLAVHYIGNDNAITLTYNSTWIEGSIINCTDADSICTINCAADFSCGKSNGPLGAGPAIYCPSTLNCIECTINCEQRQSCSGAVIYGYNCQSLIVNIKEKDNKQLTIYAPENKGSLYLNIYGSDAKFKNSTVFGSTTTNNIFIDCAGKEFKSNSVLAADIHGILSYNSSSNSPLNCIAKGTHFECPDANDCNIHCNTGGCQNLVMEALLGTHTLDFVCGANVSCVGTTLSCFTANFTSCSSTDCGGIGSCVDPILPTINSTLSPAYTSSPTNYPSLNPTFWPTLNPTANYPSLNPTFAPTLNPTSIPTVPPTTAYPTPAGETSQLMIKTDKCNVSCSSCLDTINIYGGLNADYSEASFLFDFDANTDSNTDECESECPTGIATGMFSESITNGAYDTTDIVTYNNLGYVLMMNAKTDEDIIKITIVSWDTIPVSNCSITYVVNENSFLGIHANDTLTIIYVECNVQILNSTQIAEKEETLEKLWSDMFYNQSLYVLTTEVNIIQEHFCNKSSTTDVPITSTDDGNTETTDHEITVLVVFADASDADSAKDSACDDIENCDVSTSSGVSDDSTYVDDDYDTESNSTKKIFGLLTTLQFAGIIASCLVLLVLIFIFCYYYQSRKKRKELRRLEMAIQIRKGSLAGYLSENRCSNESIRLDNNHTVGKSDTIKRGVSGFRNKNISLSIEMDEHASNKIKQDHRLIVDEDTGFKRLDCIFNEPVNYMTVDNSHNDVNANVGQILGSSYDMIEKVTNKKLALEIKYSELKFDKVIGSGKFGQVFLATWGAEKVAVKQLKSDTDEDEKEYNDDNAAEDKVNMKRKQKLKEMHAEIVLASSIPYHPNLVQVFGFVSKPLCIVMKYMNSGTVKEFVYYSGNNSNGEKRRSKRRPEIREKLIILQKAASGIKFLHEYGLYHRDIAARNILLGNVKNGKVDPSTEVRVADFGLTRSLECSEDDNKSKIGKTCTNYGPLKWMAPESIANKEYSWKSDVYMWGITMYEIFYGCEPYSEMTIITAAMAVLNSELRPKPPAFALIADEQKYYDMCPNYEALMHQCWKQNKNERPNFQIIIGKLEKMRSAPI